MNIGQTKLSELSQFLPDRWKADVTGDPIRGVGRGATDVGFWDRTSSNRNRRIVDSRDDSIGTVGRPT